MSDNDELAKMGYVALVLRGLGCACGLGAFASLVLFLAFAITARFGNGGLGSGLGAGMFAFATWPLAGVSALLFTASLPCATSTKERAESCALLGVQLAILAINTLVYALAVFLS